MPNSKWTNESYRDEEYRLGHAIQTGIKYRLTADNPWADERLIDALKHIRVGVDRTMSDVGALVGLLIQKGVITDDEWADAMIAGLQREVDIYTEEVQKLFPGIDITLA